MNHTLFPESIGMDGYQTLLGGCSDQERMRVSHGNLVRKYTVANIKTVGPSLKFVLTHNSVDNSLGAVGRNWNHSGMHRLAFAGSPVNLVTYTDDQGQNYDFEPDGSGGWKKTDDSFFLRMTLSQVSSNWELAEFGDGSKLVFDSSGVVQSIVDNHSQTLTFHYTSTKLTSIEEQTGREITLTYTGDLITKVTDPRGLETTLGYDADSNLTSIVAPEGCELTYGYAPSSTDGLILSRTDPNNNTYTYTYDGGGRLLTVTNPLSKTLTYSYDTQPELVGTASPDYHAFNRTTLVDADDQTWDYRFDKFGNLWRVLDPLMHSKRLFWSDQQTLLYVSEGYAADRGAGYGPRDNPYNRFTRNVYDSLGNQITAIDANGVITQMEYDLDSRLITVTPGRATLAVGGEWFEHFGKDGFLMCSALDDSSDLWQCPDYVDSAILEGESDTSNGFDRALPDLPKNRLDPRAPWIRLPGSPVQNTYRRTLGQWRNQGTNESFTFRIPISETKEFNLSIYTHCADQTDNEDGGYETWNRVYAANFGRDVEILVSDFDPRTGDPRRQKFRMHNTGAGVWMTFGVYAEAESEIRVLVRSRDVDEDVYPVINCIAFDPIENRRSVMTYTGSDLTAVTNPLYQTTEMDYNGDGTLSLVTDAKSRETHFYYGDAAKNLTQVVDALSGETNLIYDDDGNVTSIEDPDTRITLMEYDGKNRMTKVTDPLGHETLFEFDPAGNLVKITDALLRETEMEYNELNRLILVRDAMDNETTLDYDFTGRLLSVTDPLLRTTSFTLDAAGRRVQTDLPDGQKVLYALNAVNRLVSMTSPNAARDELTNINLTGAMNVLDNPNMERESVSDYTSGSPERWLWWLFNQAEDIASDYNHARSSAEAHSGTYSLLATTGENPYSPTTGYYQVNVPTYAGGRYLGGAWAKKAAAGASDVTVALAGVVRDFYGADQVQSDQETAIGNSWTELPPQLVEIPGDTQATRGKPPLRRFDLQCRKTDSGDAATNVYFDDASLHMLSTCFEYDGMHLREIATPDGARVRRDYDRVGRLCKVTDPNGRAIRLEYDGLDRIVKITDSLENSLEYGFDEVGNMTSFTDAKSQVMTFDYDDLNRLITITYPDTSTEEFDYSAAGDLISYIDNNLQERTFDYDDAHRLETITYPNMETVALEYDEVNNLTQRTERNGDIEVFSYDDLNRLTNRQMTPGLSSDSMGWDLTSDFDEVGNRTALRGTSAPARYGTAVYGTDRYSVTEVDQYWVVPPGGFDEMNRLVEFDDSQDNTTTFAYDADGRRTLTSCPNGVETAAEYDIVGKLLSLTTTLSSTELLKLQYGYNLASDRLALQTDKASYTYHLDRAGRLVQETINRWVTQHLEHLAQGEMDACMLDVENGRVQLLGQADDFSVLNLDRWQTQLKEYSYYGFGGAAYPVQPHRVGSEIRADQGLHLNFPSVWTTKVYESPEAVTDSVGYVYSLNQQVLKMRRNVSGDFDIALEWDGFDLPSPPSGREKEYPNGTLLTIEISLPNGTRRSYIQRRFYRYSSPSHNYYEWGYDAGTDRSASTSDVSGQFRIKRASGALTLYVWDAGTPGWTTLTGAMGSGYTTDDLQIKISTLCYSGSIQYRLVNLSNLNDLPDYSSTIVGSYESCIYDAGQTVQWAHLSWDETKPTNTDVQFQLAFSNSVDGPWSYIGPDGTSGTYFTTPAGEDLDNTSDFEGRYARFQATLETSDGVDTPSFGNVHLSFGGDGLLDSSVRNYVYDQAGNILSIETVTDAGSEVDDRNPIANPINDLNQVIQQDVGGDSWIYTWDDNGNLIGKTNGVDAWIYSWTGDENRLVRVQGPGGVDVSYTYDSIGRMLTRDDGGPDVTQLVWDNWNLIREITGDSVTTYCIPEGEILSFVRDGSRFELHVDALGSARVITDSDGDIVARYEWDAWGRALSVAEDSPLTDFPMRFVGSLGVRTDVATGLISMRQRWYSPDLGRFISRDPILLDGGPNLYVYTTCPTGFTDPMGLRPGFYGANPAEHYGYPKKGMGGAPASNKIPAFRGRDSDPHWLPIRRKQDTPGFTMEVPAGWSQRQVWDFLLERARRRGECWRTKRCYMVCTQKISYIEQVPDYRHAFLVFGPDSSQTWGLWQGDEIFKSDIRVDHWNATSFGVESLGVRCKMYCKEKSKVDKAERVAQASQSMPGYQYTVGESNLWVYLTLKMADIEWTGFDIEDARP